MKSQDKENKSAVSRCKDKAGTRINMLLVAMIVVVAAVSIGSVLQIAAADGSGFEDESELGSADISAAEDESGSDESLIIEGESQTMDGPDSVAAVTVEDELHDDGWLFIHEIPFQTG